MTSRDGLLQDALKAYRAGDIDRAAGFCAQVLSSQPRHFHALFLMGLLHLDTEQFQEAERLFAEALKLVPMSAEALYSRGFALQRLERPMEALVCFDQALKARPSFVEAEVNRGAVLMALKRHAEALASADRVLALDPRNVQALNNRGCVLVELGRVGEALAAFEAALSMKPDFADARVNQAAALASLKRYREAATAAAMALRLAPDVPYLRGHLLLYRLHACDWTALEEDVAAARQGLAAGRRLIQPFVNLLISRSLADQLECARIWVENDVRPSRPLWRGERYRHDRLRLAYVSADFHAHATAALMAGVFEHHDRSRFQTFAISYGPNDNSPMRARVVAAFDHFIDVSSRSTAEIAVLMRQMEIDIAIDLKGYTLHHRNGLFAFRPAPLQVSYLGYPGTMGTPDIDYLVADEIVIPDADRRYFTEAIAYLPGSYQCNDAARPIPQGLPERERLGLPEQGFVFCCFNNAFKIQPDVFAVWMRLLSAVEGSILWLLDDNPAASANLKREAARHGVAPERLVFAPRVRLDEHLTRHRAADLFLDTSPYGAHTTASDALWAGLPVLTVNGSTFAGRVAASLNRAAGMPELIADSLPAYEELALKLAREPEALARLKKKLAANVKDAPPFDTARITKNLEAAYDVMWRRFQAGERPCGFAVTASGERLLPPAATAPSASSLFVQGCALQKQQRYAEAIQAFDAALAVRPLFAEVLVNRGALFLATKREEEALDSLDKAVAANPALAAAWNNRGNALSALKRYREAVESFDKTLALRPRLKEALVNRATALLALGRPEEALKSSEEALAVAPRDGDALNARGNALFELKRFDAAADAYDALLRCQPDRKYALGDLAFSRLQCCDWRWLGEYRARIAEGLRQGRALLSPFQSLALLRSAADQKRAAEIWVADRDFPEPLALPHRTREARDRIRVAYLSADLRAHVVAIQLAAVFEHHDRSRFEILALSWAPDDGSPMRARLMGAFDRFLDVSGKSDREAALLLRALDVDLAVDLMGHSGDCRPGILAHRCAPVQAAFLGYAGTTGAPFIDAILADETVIPVDQRAHYSEQVVYLPDTFMPTDGSRPMPESVPARAEAGLPETGTVFCCFNNSYKFSPEIFDIWMRLLGATPNSVLFLSETNAAAKSNLRREAEARGIAPNRLVFAPFLTDAGDHLARLSLADLFLDTLPYNAHATACDALFAGVPVLTAMGSTFAGRVSASLLKAVGLPELIAPSLAAYEALALRLATEAGALTRLKAKLAERRRTAPLFDTARFTRALEAAYLAMLQANRGREETARP